MKGHFDLRLLETPGLTPELVAAWRARGLDPVRELLSYEEAGRWQVDNLVFGVSPSYLYKQAWSGATAYGPLDTRSALLKYLILTSTSAEVAYMGEETYSAGGAPPSNVPDIVTSNAYKEFINGCFVPQEIAADPTGRDAVYGTFKFLFYPGEATSNVIRSVTLWSIAYWSGQNYRVRVGRVRIKDSGGSPVTLDKGATQSLFVQYTFTMPTI